MLWTILGALAVGLLVGTLARLLLPGKQNIGVVVTVLLGAAGSLAGSWVCYRLGYTNSNGGFEIVPFVVGIVLATLLIIGYLAIARKRGPNVENTHGVPHT